MAEPEMKTCPFCAEDIKAAAIKCRYCGSELSAPVTSTSSVTPGKAASSPKLTLTPVAFEGEGVESGFRAEVHDYTYMDFGAQLQNLHLTGTIHNNSGEQQWLRLTTYLRTSRGAILYNTGSPGVNEVPPIPAGGSAKWATSMTLRRDSLVTGVQYTVAYLADGEEYLATDAVTELRKRISMGSGNLELYSQIFTLLISYDCPAAGFPSRAADGRPQVGVTTPPSAGLAPRRARIDEDVDAGTGEVGYVESGEGVGSPSEWTYAASAVPATEWAGRRYMTRKSSVPLRCTNCHREDSVEASVANTLALEQGLAGRLQRGGTNMEKFGATFSPFSSGRRIAAGNESDRQQQKLVDLYRLISCRACGSSNILLARL